VIWRRSGFADNQFRRDGKFLGIVLEALDTLEQNARGGFTHVMQGLANRGETRVVIGGDVNVVETALSGAAGCNASFAAASSPESLVESVT
jgi:hypothetical protein